MFIHLNCALIPNTLVECPFHRLSTNTCKTLSSWYDLATLAERTRCPINDPVKFLYSLIILFQVFRKRAI